MKYVVAAIVVALAAVAIPNLHNAMLRSEQKRTMGDMRTIATAWEARAEESKTYIVGRPGNVSYEALRRVLEPTYVKHLPRTDGWGNPFRFSSTDQEYSVRSMGSDHRLDAKVTPGPTTDFARDIIYENGSWVVYPEGI
jgi:type II secretory pathway pseudopilin PulG